MASGRQQNWLGQQRVDIPHLRSLEAGVAGDFDVLAGRMLAGQLPVVVQGFDLITTGAIGADAEALVLQVAEGELIHFEAAESGSIFRVPADRANETLGPTNARVQGSFTPSATNFVGIDLVRTADDTTEDLVQFLDAATNSETGKRVPLARTMDYRVVVSTTEFTATPGIAPLAKVETDSSNKVVTLTDARHLMFRLGTGGSTPSDNSPFSWPGGRDESSSTLSTVAGDRSIFSLKDWLNAAMTRFWELGGGEYWYSLTADRNVRMATSGAVFSSTGEHFEWDTTHLHWRGIAFSLDNSNGDVNEVADQLTDSEGLTDLLDGECIYVDLDRSTDRTGGSALTAQKGVLATLGGSSRPGQRWVIAWRRGANILVRDRAYPVGSSFVVATADAHGTTRLSGNVTGLPGVAYVAPIISLASGILAAGGISHATSSIGTNNLTTPGPIQIGLGGSEGDEDVIVTTEGAQYQTIIQGTSDIETVADKHTLLVQNTGVNHTTKALTRLTTWKGFGGTTVDTAMFIESHGAVGLRNIDGDVTPDTPAPTATEDVRSKFFIRTNGVASPNTRDQFCIIWHDGSVSVIAESPTY